MKEELKQLESLRERVASTWQLLDIDKQVEEMRSLEQEMQASDFWNDAEKAKSVSQRHEELRKEIDTWTTFRDEVDELILLARELEQHPDSEMKADIEKRIAQLNTQFERLEFFLLLNEKHDRKNAIVSVRSGSGGTEAQDWAEMLQRMLFRYVENKNWNVTLIDETKGQEAGIKASMFRVEGRYAYGHLKAYHGTHRLVRISPFDAEQMRHTSFALIEVIPEVEVAEQMDIDPKDLRIDTFMAGGKGGQSVNTTYSAVRIVHIPTGITVQCQNERSQLQNRETAMSVLKSRLQQLKDEEEEKERQKLRGEYKSPEWGNQICSYVLHPYKMVKDVRTRHETKDPEAVLNGELDPFIEAYLRWHKEEQK